MKALISILLTAVQTAHLIGLLGKGHQTVITFAFDRLQTELQ